MTSGLFSVFDALPPPSSTSGTAPVFVVRQVARFQNYYVGKDGGGKACLLIRMMESPGRSPPPIRLESIDAQFELLCQVTDGTGETSEGKFTVVRCRSTERETIWYFFSVCQIIARHLGDEPSRNDLAQAVQKLASIFQNIGKPPVKSLNGLFGELFFISRSRRPTSAIRNWRIDESARYDFSVDDIRFEVKTAAGRRRLHTFSYEQCNPPQDTHAIVASFMIERAPNGIKLHDLISDIERSIGGDEDLLIKLHRIVSSTLGSTLREAFEVTFDQHLAADSLLFFDLRSIPAIRGEQPPGVSDVRFVSDLSRSDPIGPSALIDLDPLFWDFMPEDQAEDHWPE
ncbi:MAG: PD-(D/E)XK motif protein [Pseudomonadota bacterium]